MQVLMFGFRSDNSAEHSGRSGENIRLTNLSLKSQLEGQVQQLSQPLLQGLEEGLKTRTWQLQRSNTALTGPGRLGLHHDIH